MSQQPYTSRLNESTERRRLSRDEIEACALNLAQMDSGAQFDLLSCIAGDFLRGIPVAQGEGIGPDCFHNDLKIIYSGFEVGCEEKLDLPRTLAIIRTALTEANYWDESQIAANMVSCQWGSEKLVFLTGLWFHSEDAIRQRSRKLLLIIEHIARIRRMSRDLMAAYEGLNVELVGTPRAPVRPQQPWNDKAAKWVGFLRSSRRSSAA
jgi:hypothetical protein